MIRRLLLTLAAGLCTAVPAAGQFLDAGAAAG